MVMKSGGGMKITNFQIKQMIKKYFDTFSDAEIWKMNTTEEHDGVIRKEAGRYYIFVEDTSQK